MFRIFLYDKFIIVIINLKSLFYISKIIKICPKKKKLHQFLIFYVKLYSLHLFLVIQCCNIYFLIYEIYFQRFNMKLLF